MSKERKFHALIENLDKEEKNRVWSAIKEQEELMNPKDVIIDTKKSRSNVFLRKAIAVASSLIIVLGLSIFAVIKFFPTVSSQLESSTNGQIEDSSNSSEIDEFRYCNTNDYKFIETDMTLKDYNSLEQKTFQYLDWYDITDYCVDGIYQLNETGETIGYREEIVDINTGSLVKIDIILREYQLQDFDFFQNTELVAYINNMQIEWRCVDDLSYAQFKYGEYDYYVTLEYAMETDSILDIVQELLN